MSIRRRLTTAALAVVLFLAAVPSVLALDGRVIDARTGKPIPNAEVTILGRPGAVYTDADGRFTWKPDPAPPFEVLVILPGERFTKPVLIESVPAAGPLEVRVSSARRRDGDRYGRRGARYRGHGGSRHGLRAVAGHRHAAARQPDAGARERGRRLERVGGPRGRAGHSRPRARAHADSHRRRARDQRPPRRAQRDLPRSVRAGRH